MNHWTDFLQYMWSFRFRFRFLSLPTWVWQTCRWHVVEFFEAPWGSFSLKRYEEQFFVGQYLYTFILIIKMYLNSVFSIAWIVEHGYISSKIMDLIPGNACNSKIEKELKKKKYFFICHIRNYTEYNQQWNVFSAFNPSKWAHTWSPYACQIHYKK